MSGDSVAESQIRAFVERVERLDEELKAINADKKEIFAEARGNGFDVPALKQVIKLRRQDANERMEREAIVELYMSALGMIETPDFDEPRVQVQARVREADENTTPAETEITEPQPTKAAGQASTVIGAFPSSVENEAAEISTPIQSEPDDAAVTAGDVLREPAAAEQGQNIREGDAPREADRSGGDASRPDTEPDATPAGAVVAARNGVTAGETASITYPAPGVVTMEHTPPEGIVAHPFAAVWPVNNIDVSEGVREPIVKIGKLILDGRGRYFAARAAGTPDNPMQYPVVQYNGADPLMDCIRWNLASRPGLHPHNLKMIATKLVKVEPDRADEIMDAFGLDEGRQAAE